MKALILDGSRAADSFASSIQTALTDELHAGGADIQAVRVADQHIGPCLGDFFCWIRLPGICVQADDNQVIAQAFMQSDLVIFLTPITFGGYSSELKRAVDHLIPNVSPFFMRIDGEVHHRRRYPCYPRLLVIGWLPQADPLSESVFHHLVSRNAINFHAPAAISGVVYAHQSPAEARPRLVGWLQAALTCRGHSSAPLPQEENPGAAEVRPAQRALLLVGSPRGQTSTSQSLGGYLFERLAERNVQTQTIRLYTVLKSELRQRALVQAVAEADLVILAFPLYVDSLPAPIIQTLEMIAAQHPAEAGIQPPQRFAVIVNCGFPEATHNRAALAICRNFARLSGFEWAGGLSLGAGGVVDGVPLNQLDRRAVPIKHALELAAVALALGQPIPAEAVNLLAKPIIPAWLYCLFAGFRWRQRARRYHVQKRLNAQPYKPA